MIPMENEDTSAVRRIASEWYSHGSTELYKLVSTGWISPNLTEQVKLIDDLIDITDYEDRKNLTYYVLSRINGCRFGPVENWSELHW